MPPVTTAINLEGKVSLITGSSRGIGQAIALAFATVGCDVAIHYRTFKEGAESVAAEILQMGRRSLVLQADVRNGNKIHDMVEQIHKEFGRLDILVNNAGYALGKPFLETSEQDWRDQIDTLSGGYFRCIQAVLPGMVRQGSGVILNIASTCGLRGSPGEAVYAAANGAIIAFTHSLAAEFGLKNIRMNALLVAWASNAFNPLDPVQAAYLPHFALRRVTNVTEIAQAAVYLCSDLASGITGAILPVDAGFLCS